MVVRSILEDALGPDVPAVHAVLIGVFNQIDTFRGLHKSRRGDFQFRIKGSLARKARGQYHDAMTLNEQMLDDAVAMLYGAENGPFRRFFITKARCDRTDQVVMRRGEIGVDIPENEDRAVLAGRPRRPAPPRDGQERAGDLREQHGPRSGREGKGT